MNTNDFIDETPQLSRDEADELHHRVWMGSFPTATHRQRYRARNARTTLVETNLRLVKRVVGVKLMASGTLDFDDLFQDGVIGLMHAVERYNPTLGIPFGPYAFRWISHYIDRAIANTGRTVRVPIHIDRELRSMRAVTALLEQDLGREPEADEIASELSATTDHVLYLQSLDLPIDSLDRTISSDSGGEIERQIPEPIVEGPEDRIVDLFDVLDDDERDLLDRRFGLTRDRQTQVETADELGCTVIKIQQRQRLAIAKMRAAA